jgi:hypothetical protein
MLPVLVASSFSVSEADFFFAFSIGKFKFPLDFSRSRSCVTLQYCGLHYKQFFCIFLLVITEPQIGTSVAILLYKNVCRTREFEGMSEIATKLRIFQRKFRF